LMLIVLVLQALAHHQSTRQYQVHLLLARILPQ